MSLKEIDIKTFEAYKKAIHNDVTKITDTSKIKFWIYKDVELPDLKGKKEKIPVFLVLADDAGVRTPLHSKKVICNGFCHLESGQVAFDAIKGKVPYKRLKAALPVFLGKKLYIPPNVNPDAEDTDDEGSEVETEEKSSDVSASASLMASWTALLGQVQAAIAAAPARKDALNRAANGIPELIKANDVKAATEKMEAVRVLLNAPQTTQPSESQSAGPDLAAAWEKLFKKAQSIIAATPARKDEIVRAAAGIPELVKARAPEAQKRMDVFDALLNTTPSTSGPNANVLKEEWGKLSPRIKASGDAALIQAAADGSRKLGELVSQGKLAEAQKLIDQLTGRLDGLKTQASTSKLSANDVTSAWQKLVPEMQQKSALHPEVKAEAMRVRKQIEELTNAGKLDEAKQAIDKLAEYLSKVSADAPKSKVESESKPEESSEKVETESKPPENPKKAEYEKKRKVIDKEIKYALQEQIGDTGRIRAADALAVERALDGDYATALKVLAGLTTLLADTDTDDDDTPVGGLMEYRRSLGAFNSARRRAEAQLEALTVAIPNTLPDEVDVAEELAEEFQEEMEELQELIDGAVNASKDAKAPADAALKSKIQKTIQQLESNPLLQLAEKNPFGVAIDVRVTLTAALKVVLESIPVAA